MLYIIYRLKQLQSNSYISYKHARKNICYIYSLLVWRQRTQHFMRTRDYYNEFCSEGGRWNYGSLDRCSYISLAQSLLRSCSCISLAQSLLHAAANKREERTPSVPCHGGEGIAQALAKGPQQRFTHHLNKQRKKEVT